MQTAISFRQTLYFLSFFLLAAPLVVPFFAWFLLPTRRKRKNDIDMYADQLAGSSHGSIKDRLDGDVNTNFRPERSRNSGKGPRQNEDKWKHDLYEEGRPNNSKLKVDVRDLRFKLDNKKIRQKAYHGLKTSGVKDLRQLLSGTMHPQSTSKDPPKAKQTKLEPARTNKKSVQATASHSKIPAKSPSLAKKSQEKDASSVLVLLQSLGLEKYSITFQAEEIDMAALSHMNDDDLKALGIPMGPRKKILLALESKS